MELKSFRVEKLHGVYDFELKFQDNTLILVGENGSGKSTLMKMLFYTLSHQWIKLAQYKFEYIRLKFKDFEEIIIDRNLLDFSKSDQRINQLPPNIRKSILNGDSLSLIENECRRFQFPFTYVLQIMNSVQKGNNSLRERTEKIMLATAGVHILYLPTYRRIEQDLNVVLSSRLEAVEDDLFLSEQGGFQMNHDHNYSEIVGFGMRDVERLIENTSAQLRYKFSDSLNNLIYSYLGETLNKEFTNIKASQFKNIDSDTIYEVLGRVDIKYLPSRELIKKTLKNIQETGKLKNDDKVVLHYLLKLLESYNLFKYQEDGIIQFANICDKYLSNKEVKYSSLDFRLYIIRDGINLNWNQLSSGEKQVVSLFSHLYLDGKKNYFLLIDEPELSLSLVWQQMFLQDVKNATFCKGVFAVTHSPFIFDNDLKSYAHGINEFSMK